MNRCRSLQRAEAGTHAIHSTVRGKKYEEDLFRTHMKCDGDAGYLMYVLHCVRPCDGCGL